MLNAMKPHAQNVPGDYYVEDGCCITCGVPLDIAPEFLRFCGEAGGNSHCYVHCQPKTAGEHALMATAMKAADVGCIRYRGSDALVRRRLGDMGLQDQIDEP